MKIITSDTHRRHNPPYQFNVTELGAYSESPDRVDRILEAVTPHHDILSPSPIDHTALTPTHTDAYLTFLEGAYPAWAARGGSPDGLIPFTFAKHSTGHIPDDPVHAAGHYCFDAQTPIVAGTWDAALASAACALTAADHIQSGDRVAYALCRPPGHHASTGRYGGYSFLNNAALAANHLGGRVAILDIDYHHGNGTQDIFYDRPDVLFISIHADPRRAYPYFSGSATEAGAGPGVGTTRNFPLPPSVDDDAYLEVLDAATNIINGFRPHTLILSAGLDIYEHDPLGDFHITLDGFTRIAQALSDLNLPTLIIQEGGYATDALGPCAAHLLSGFES